jgi:hypothetical protein
MSRFEEFSAQDITPHVSFNHKQLRRGGILIMFLSVSSFAVFFYVTLLSWWQPTLSNRFIDAIRDNNYYLLLLPVLIPTLVFFTWMNWLGMQFFKRN